MKRKLMQIGRFVVASLLATALPVFAAETIKIAYIDPMSGPFALVGEAGAKHYQFAINEINARGGVLGGRKFELITFDNKGSAQESVIALKRAADQGARFITQGNGSNVAAALIDGANKLYERSPEQAVLFLNYAAVDPELTNEKASFWHFRFDANSDMKIAGIVNYMASQKNIKKVYIIGQDYAHGRVISAASKKMLAEKRPDIKIVGDELHPMGKVKDFTPYIAKIKASGAQAVITGNWGNDLILLIKAGKESGLMVDWYTFYGGSLGTPAAIGDAGIGHIRQVSDYHKNIANTGADAWIAKFEKERKKPLIDFYYLRIMTIMDMLAKAIEQTKSTDPKKVGKALEGMKVNTAAGEVWMRPEDHQLMSPLYLSVMDKAGNGTKLRHDIEDSGYGFRTEAVIKMQDSILPTTAKIVRP